MMNALKERTLPMSDFLSAIQLEYMSFFIRKLFYKKAKDLVFFDKILEHKKTKIKDISLRQAQQSIFSSEEVWLKYSKEILSPFGLFPNLFVNKNSTEFLFKDKKNFFNLTDSYFLFNNYDVDSIIGEVKIIKIDYYKNTATVVDRNGIEYFLKDITKELVKASWPIFLSKVQ